MKMFKFLLYFQLLLIRQSFSHSPFNCRIPNGCQIETVHHIDTIQNEKYNPLKYQGITCEIPSKGDFHFEFILNPLLTNQSCLLDAEDSYNELIFRWPAINNIDMIIDKRLNLSNVIKYTSYFEKDILLVLFNVNGFDIDLYESSLYTEQENRTYYIGAIQCIKCQIRFFTNRRLVSSCEDLSNSSRISSIFQNQFDSNKVKYSDLELIRCEYRNPICPLIFNNSYFDIFTISDLVNTFYKENILSFHTIGDLNSNINTVNLIRIIDINVDLKLFNPSVFRQTNKISIFSDSVQSIDANRLFTNLSSLRKLELTTKIFRKMSHKYGTEWIGEINKHLHVNMTEFSANYTRFKDAPRFLIMGYDGMMLDRRVLTSFPDADFCLYKQFPFDQLVIFYEINSLGLSNKNVQLTCTYLWLVKYYQYYLGYFNDEYSFEKYQLLRILNSSSFKSLGKCEFSQRLSLCDKTTYIKKDVWTDSDYRLLNKKLQIAVKISLYLVSFLGLTTHIIIIIVLLKKENSDLFKEYKQFSYLCLNSVFCLMISVIEILSWMTECFYPFEVFCPEIRKLIAMQFFKIIFKECLVTVFRFMCNFTYVAFALNRISLIGKDHGKVVTFMSDLGIKKYIGATIFISILLSWMKYFNFEVNYNYSHLNYPIPNEYDILQTIATTFSHAYFISNSISDLINYLVFVLISFVIDLCMIVQLRRTLEERANKCLTSANKKQQVENENEEAVNNAIKMVVINTAIGILFKLPVSFIPLLNSIGVVYFTEVETYHSLFYSFYSTLIDTGSFGFILDLTNLLYTVSFSIQIFVYNRFDKKFRTGYDRVKEAFCLRIRKKQ